MPPSRKVLRHLRRMQRQGIHVDDVDAGLLAHFDDATLGEPEQLRGVVGLPPGTGKTRRWLAQSAVLWPGAAVVSSSKDDLMQMLSRDRYVAALSSTGGYRRIPGAG